jgi:hypothetical protein
LKRQSGFRDYLASAALAFGVVLFASLILQTAYGGLSPEEREPLYGFVVTVYLGAHIVGGFLGSYLVSRVRHNNFIKTGIITGTLAYILEFVYNIVVEAAFTDIYALLSLLIGCIIGSMFYLKVKR